MNFGEWDGYTTAEYLLRITNNSDQPLSITGYSTRTEAYTLQTDFPVEIAAGGVSEFTVQLFAPGIEHGYIEDVMTINSDITSDTLVRRVSQQLHLFATQYDATAPTSEIPIDNATWVPVDTTFLLYH